MRSEVKGVAGGSPPGALGRGPGGCLGVANALQSLRAFDVVGGKENPKVILKLSSF